MELTYKEQLDQLQGRLVQLQGELERFRERVVQVVEDQVSDDDEIQSVLDELDLQRRSAAFEWELIWDVDVRLLLAATPMLPSGQERDWRGWFLEQVNLREVARGAMHHLDTEFWDSDIEDPDASLPDVEVRGVEFSEDGDDQYVDVQFRFSANGTAELADRRNARELSTSWLESSISESEPEFSSSAFGHFADWETTDASVDVTSVELR